MCVGARRRVASVNACPQILESTFALDRCHRDARTAVQHVVLQQNNYEHAGRLLSVEPSRPVSG